MAYAIACISKLKKGNINSSAQHVSRERVTPNADENIDNIRFIGEEDHRQLNQVVIERIGDQTIRTNAVLAVEMLLSASPEYFRPNSIEKAGYYEPRKLEDWKKQVEEWLNNEYGDRIVRAELHLDESTPHIHAYLVPLDDNGKLNCRGLFGGRDKMTRFQNSYAQAMSPLGLERGIKGSKAQHTKIKKYYAAVNSSPDKSLSPEEIDNQLVDRQRAIREKEQALVTAKSLLRENNNLNQRLNNAQNTIASQDEQIHTLKNKYENLGGELKDLSLNNVIYELGFTQDNKDKNRWTGQDNKVTITGSKFYDWNLMKGGDNVIDLVTHINQCNFQDSVVWLNEHFGQVQTIEAVSQKVLKIIESKPETDFVPPAIVKSKWQKIKDYLTNQRKLPSSLIDRLHENGLIYGDKNQNIVFLRRSMDKSKVTGANLKGISGENINGLAKGSKRNSGWFYFERGESSQDSVKRIVLVASPIDALSLSVMERTQSKKTIYLSTEQSDKLPLNYLRDIDELVIAFDNHESGKAMTKDLKSKLPKAKIKTPKSANWNQDLINLLDWSKSNQKLEDSVATKSTGKGFSL